ncbi:hypothetical protein L9F63_009316 [Diploptera punctata]|uniref:MADF domain-containing protein n=1 Tax=Diploptera punctata TaxID=6984 RepID=A0AAD8ERU0_DIPPU|nr:hypothetical protein L9F63_009316 [Diploptera punctata]
MNYEIDNDILISLVEARSVFWDETLDTFKDRNATKDARRQVSCELNENFEEMESKEKMNSVSIQGVHKVLPKLRS